MCPPRRQAEQELVTAADRWPTTPALTSRVRTGPDSPTPRPAVCRPAGSSLGVRASSLTPDRSDQVPTRDKSNSHCVVSWARDCSYYNVGERSIDDIKRHVGKKRPASVSGEGKQPGEEPAGEEGQVPGSQQWQLRTRGSWPRAWPRPWCGQRGLRPTWQLLMVCVSAFQPECL